MKRRQAPRKRRLEPRALEEGQFRPQKIGPKKDAYNRSRADREAQEEIDETDEDVSDLVKEARDILS